MAQNHIGNCQCCDVPVDLSRFVVCEPCRKIIVERLKKRARESRRMIRTAQDAAVLAIGERGDFERRCNSLSNMVTDYGNKLLEWQKATGCSHPEAARQKLAMLKAAFDGADQACNILSAAYENAKEPKR